MRKRKSRRDLEAEVGRLQRKLERIGELQAEDADTIERFMAENRHLRNENARLKAFSKTTTQRLAAIGAIADPDLHVKITRSPSRVAINVQPMRENEQENAS
jgi:hypothetical protein